MAYCYNKISINLSKVILLLFLLSIYSIADENAAQKNVRFIINSDFPIEGNWVGNLLKRAERSFRDNFAPKNATYPDEIKVIIKKNNSINGVNGYASRKGDIIGFSSNVWDNDKYRRWIMIHEMINLLSSYYGSEAYPSDWWANGRSPFPEYASSLTLKNIGELQDYVWRKNLNIHKKDHLLFWKLDEKYGTKIFRDFFYLLKKDKIDFKKIGKPWPNPDKERSLVAIGYLSKASGENLAKLFSYHEVGQKPDDWQKRHPEIRFKTYNITEEDIESFLTK